MEYGEEKMYALGMLEQDDILVCTLRALKEQHSSAQEYLILVNDNPAGLGEALQW